MAAGYCYCLGIKSNDFFLKDNKKAFILWLNVPKVTAYECLGQGKNVYFKPRTNLSELVEAIETLLPTITDVRTRAVFQAKINEYKVSVRDATLMKDTVNLLKFYQKITMHPMSHGTLGIPHFCRKDVEESIKLLEQLDKCVTSILDGKV